MALATLEAHITTEVLNSITELAKQNFAPSDIALKLELNKRDFLHVWRDKTSAIRESYERGKLEIAVEKEKALIKMMNADNVTAYQIHEKKAQEQAFEDAKADVFGF